MKTALLIASVSVLSLGASLAAAHSAPDAVPAKEGSEALCSHPESGPAAAPAVNGVVLRGEKLPSGKALTVAELMASAATLDGKSALVEGDVRRACSRKGCWMELAPKADAKGPGIRVTFKDYAFFVPTDSAGSKARVQGTVKVATLAPDLAAHYESEGATVPRGADGQPREIQIVATGVELHR
jgi:hypothetical protein